MKTIKERAIEKYPVTAENMDKALAMRKLYEEIAEEQKALDEAGLPRWKRCGDELPEPDRDILLNAYEVGDAWLSKHNWNGHEVVLLNRSDDISFEPMDHFEWVYMEEVTKMIRAAEDEK